MPEEGEHVHIEQQSNAGKWILVFFAVVLIAVFGYAHYLTHARVAKLSKDLDASRAQVAELQKRVQSTEAEEETLGQRLGMTKKDLAQRAAQLQAQQKAAEARLEKEQKEQLGQVSGEVAGVKTDVGGVQLNLRNATAVRKAWNAIKTSVAKFAASRKVQTASSPLPSPPVEEREKNAADRRANCLIQRQWRGSPPFSSSLAAP